MERIYLDNSATTRVFPEAVREMVRCMEQDFGNPSSIHFFGRQAKKMLDQAREQVATLIHGEPSEIFFTSGGTEADNLAIFGIANRYEKGHLITTAIEHQAVLASCRELEKRGFRVTYLPVNSEGLVSVRDFEKAICPDTIFISVMHGNNEVGTIQPVAEIGQIARKWGIPFHVDAVQSLGKIRVDVREIPCDFLTCSSHKINGPKGVGALYCRKGTPLSPILFGGGQENNLRSGTENLPGIVGFGAAAVKTALEWPSAAAHLTELREYFFDCLEHIFGADVRINGSRSRRLPNNIHFSLKEIDGLSMLLLLDSEGIAVSTGSACHSDSSESSHVLKAMGLAEEWTRGALRLTLAPCHTKKQLDRVLFVLQEKRELLLEAETLYQRKKKGVR